MIELSELDRLDALHSEIIPGDDFDLPRMRAAAMVILNSWARVSSDLRSAYLELNRQRPLIDAVRDWHSRNVAYNTASVSNAQDTGFLHYWSFEGEMRVFEAMENYINRGKINE